MWERLAMAGGRAMKVNRFLLLPCLLGAIPAMAAGFDLSFGSLPSNDSVTVTFEVVVNQDTPPGTARVAAYGMVRGDNLFTTFTDDPDVGGGTDPTETPVVVALDAGDAPAPYPTLAADNGASHTLRHGFYLGGGIDAEPDGQPDPGATGDDADAPVDDEDGVALPRAIASGPGNPVRVVASAGGLLSAWIDINRDGDWDDAGERVLADQPIGSGTNQLDLTLPILVQGGPSYARFRFSSMPIPSPSGHITDGEVEDYLVDLYARPRLWIEVVSGGYRVYGQGGPGRTHAIESTDELVPSAWQPLGTRTGDPLGEFDIDDLREPGIRRFYRTVLP